MSDDYDDEEEVDLDQYGYPDEEDEKREEEEFYE